MNDAPTSPTPPPTASVTTRVSAARGGLPMQAWAALMVLAVTLPLGLLLVYNAGSEARVAEEAAAQRVDELAHQAAAEADAFLDDTRQLLARLAQRPQIRAMQSSPCDPLFAEFRAQYPRYANLVLIDPRGGGVCGHGPLIPGEASYADFEYFRAVSAGADYHVAGPWLGRTTRRWIAASALPVLDDAGTRVGVLALAIDLAQFPLPLLRNPALAPGITLDLVDGQGVFVARADGHERIGTPASPALEGALQSGATRATLDDDAGRAYATAIAPMTQAPWHVVAGIPVDVTAGAVRERLQDSLAVGGLVLVGVWSIAALGVRRALRPLREVARVASAVAAGHTGARVEVSGPKEIAAIAEGFNRMLDQREHDEAALRASEASYRALFEASRESEERFRAMADSSPVLIWMADADIQEFFFNATWLAFTGQTADEAKSAGWFSGVHPDDAPAVQEVIDRANLRHEGCTIEYRRRRYDGEWRWLLDTSAPRRDASGRFLGYAGTAVDIHDRVVAEGRIRRVTRLYSALSQVNEAIARSDELAALMQRVCEILVRETGLCTAVVAFADEQGATLRNVGVSGLFADHFRDLVVPIAAMPPGRELPGSLAFREARTVVSNDREHDRDGLLAIRREEMRARLRSSAVLPLRRHGEPVGVLAVYAEETGFFDQEMTDLLELLATDLAYALEAIAARERRDLAEDELKRLNATLEERVADRTRSLEAANRELEAFTYSVSHDLRAPLRGISGFSELLHEGYVHRLDDTGRNYLDRVKAASLRMSRLIDDLLDLSRIARQAIHRSDVDVSALAADVVAEVRENEPARDVTVTIAPGLHATADPGLARIALRNLIDNAWKFTSRTPHARIDVVAGEIDGRPACTVRDNGAGFDPAYADKLFAPFQRLHAEREFGGTGIGLAIVQRIVHRHGGTIRTFAAPGEGAAFTFTLGGAADRDEP